MHDNTLQYKVVVKGAYGNFNFGDDALMLAVNELLELIYTKDQIAYYCHNNMAYLRKLIPDLEVIQPSSGFHLKADMCLYGGGTQFYSFSSNVLTMIKAMFKDSLRPLYRQINGAYRRILSLHNPYSSEKYNYLAAIGIGIGPFNDRYSEHKTANLFKKMAFVAARDLNSYSMCQRHNITNSSIYSDLCYWPRYVNNHITNKMEKNIPLQNKIGIIVRDWSHDVKGDAYADNLILVVESMKDRRIDVEVILFAGIKDKLWIERLKKNNLKYVMWDPDVNSIESFLEYMSSFDMFLTSRYHGAVFASLLDKPCICIGIEQKLEMFAEVLGRGGRLWQYPFNVNDCVELIENIFTSYPLTVSALQSSVENQKILAQKMVEDFIRFCSSKLDTKNKAIKHKAIT